MSEKDKHFIKRYEELLDKGYCDCNEMNCIDNNSPRRILNIVKDLQNQLQQKENIIKEVREYIEMHTPSDIGICGNKTKRYYTLGEDSVDHILEILDKEVN